MVNLPEPYWSLADFNQRIHGAFERKNDVTPEYSFAIDASETYDLKKALKELNDLFVNLDDEDQELVFLMEAFVYELDESFEKALAKYTLLFDSKDGQRSYLAYFHAARLFIYHFKEEQKALELLSDYQKKYPITSQVKFSQQYLIYYLYIKVLVCFDHKKEADKLMYSIQSFSGWEASCLQIAWVYWSGNKTRGDNLYKTLFSKNALHSSAPTGLNLNPDPDELDEVYFFRNMDDSVYFHQPFYKPENRMKNEMFVYQAFPFCDVYSITLKIKDDCLNQVFGAFCFADEELTRFMKPFQANLEAHSHLEVGKWYIDIGQESDWWMGDYELTIEFLRMLAPYLEDAYFFIYEGYHTWIDELELKGGVLFFNRHQAKKDGFWDDKIKVIEVISKTSKEPKKTWLRHLLAQEHYSSAELDFLDRQSTMSQKDVATIKEELSDLKKALAFNPDHLEALLLYAKCLYFLKKTDQAEVNFKKVLSLKNENLEAIYFLGRIAQNRDQKEEAMDYFASVLKFNPVHKEALEGLRRLTPTNEKHELNQRLCDIYTQELKKEIDRKEKLKSSSYFIANLKNTLQSIQKKRKDDPENIELVLEEANVLFHMKEFKKAIAIYQKASGLKPNDPQLLLWQAQAWFFLKEHKRAMELIDQAIELDPKRAESWAEKGSLHAEIEEYKEAEKCFDQAEQLNPDFYFLWYGRVCLLAKIGENEKALALLKKILKKHPDKKKELRFEKDFEPLYGEMKFWGLMN